MVKFIKMIFCGHNYKGGIRCDTHVNKGKVTKKYYTECKLCGKKKYVWK